MNSDGLERECGSGSWSKAGSALLECAALEGFFADQVRCEGGGIERKGLVGSSPSATTKIIWVSRLASRNKTIRTIHHTSFLVKHVVFPSRFLTLLCLPTNQDGALFETSRLVCSATPWWFSLSFAQTSRTRTMLSVVEHPPVSSVGVVEYERAYDSRRRICAMPASKQVSGDRYHPSDCCAKESAPAA